jgi:dolichol-phosphate mannosyltransferase
MTFALSLVVPVFNEEAALPHSLSRLIGVLSKIEGKCQIILVNDGSQDGSLGVIERFHDESASSANVRVEYLDFSRNFGHSAAVLAGLELAMGEVVGIIDADLQDPPELIPQMLEVMRESGADVVYGQRIRRKGESLFKRLTAWLFYRTLDVLAGVPIPRDAGDFRVMSKQVRSAVLACREQDPFLRGIVAWVGFRQVPLRYVRDERRFGSTKYGLRKMLRLATIAIVGFSNTPLLFSIGLGGLGVILSLLLAGWIYYGWTVGRTIPGWASLMLALTLFQSLSLFVLGVHGYYLGRAHKEVMGRPRYVVRRSSVPGREVIR